jgi:hypothetical protein
MIKFSITFGFKNWVRFSIFHRVSDEMQVCLATLRPLNFSKEKKEKKESHSFKWKVSKKQVFLKKYYPIHDRKW